MLELSTIRITGEDAFEFLQGQLTNDLGRLGPAAEILSAWCNPKGRVIWFGTVREINGGYALAAPTEIAEEVVNRLTIFRFRAKVEFEIVADAQTVDEASLIEKGHPWIGQTQLEQFTPHMLNLDLLDAISLDKGCYTGQEVVARTHYKGATKRRTLRFECDGPIAAGDKVNADDRSVGEVLNVAGNELLAVVPVDKAGASLTVNDRSLTYIELPYLTL